MSTRSLLKWAAWGLGGLVGLVVLAIALLHTPPARRWALKQIVQIMDKQGIAFDSSSFGYNLLELSATLNDVVIRAPQAPDLPPLLRADRVNVDIGLRSFLGGKYRIEDAVVRNPRLHLVVDKDGRTNIPQTPEKQKQEETKTNFVIDKLLISGGDLRVEDRRQNASVHVPLQQIVVDGNPATENHDITLTAASGGTLSFENRTLPLQNVAADLLLKEKGVEIRKLTAGLGPSRVSASGTIDDFDNPRLDIQGDTNLVLDSLVKFAGVTQTLDGNAHIAFEAEGTIDQLVATADIEGQDLQVDRLRNIDLTAKAQYDRAASRARLQELNIDLPAGNIRGTADIALTSAAGQSTANIAARNVDLQSLSSSFRAPVRIASRATGDIAARWPGMEYKQAAADATIRLTPTRSTPAQDVLPVSGTIDAKSQGERTLISLKDVRTLDAQIDGQVTVVNQRALDGNIRMQAPELSATVPAAEAFLGRAPGTLLGTPVSGPLNITADLGGTVQSRSAVAKLDALGLTVGDLQGIDIRAAADYNPDRLVLESANLTWRDQSIAASGRVGLSGNNAPVSLSARSESISIPTVLAGMNRGDLPVSGNAQFVADVRGTTKSPEADVQLTATDLVAYNEPFGTMAARAELRGRTLTIPDLRLEKPQPGGEGLLRASGSYNLDTKLYTLDAKSDNLRLTSMTLPDGRPVRGELDISAQSRGATANPTADLNVSARDLQVGPQQLGSVNLVAHLEDQQAAIEASAPAFNLAAKADIGVKEPYPATFEVRADNTDLKSLPVKMDQPVTGTVTATVRGTGPLADFADEGQATAQIAALDLQYQGQPVRSEGPLVASYGNQMLTIERATLLLRDSRIDVAGKLPLDDRAGAGTVNLSAKLDLPSLVQYLPDQQQLTAAGTASIDGTIRGTLKRIDPDVVLSLENGSFATATQKIPLTDVDLRAQIQDGALELQTANAQLGVANISASGTVPFGLLPANLPVELPRRQGAAQFTAELKALNLADLGTLPENVGGTVSARLEAQASRPELTALNGRLTFPELQVKIGSYALEQSGTSEILVQNGMARVTQFTVTGPETQIQVAGTAGLAGKRPMDLKVEADFDAGIASLFTDTVQAQGDAELRASVTGTVQNPQAQGYLQLASGQFSMRDPRIGIEDLDLRVDLAGTKATISRLDGVLNGGDLSGGGSIEYANGSLRNASLNVNADDVYMNVPEGLRTVSDINLRVNSEGENIVVGGRVNILEGGYTEDKITRALLARATSPRALDLTEERNRLLENIRFNIRVTTQNPILIDNSLAEAEITTDLRVLGNPYEPGLSGRLTLEEGGELRLQERTYVIERAVVTFTSDVRIEPNLDLLATTTAEGYDIRLQVTGQPGETETVLTSDPPLPEPDILALLVTGKTMDEIRGQEYEVARNQVLSYLTGRIGSQLGRTIAGATGLSTVRIEPNLIAAETDPSARLTVGQDITRNLELIYSMDLVNSSDQIYLAEYELSKRFSTRGIRQADGSFRFDFNHDITFGGVPGPRRGRKQEQRRIGDVSIIGNTYFSDMKVVDKLDVESGDRYDFFKARRGLDRVEKLYADQNLLEARVRMRREQREGDVVDLNVNVNPGPKVDLVFEGITVPGDIRDKVRDAWRSGVFDIQRADDSIQALRSWLVSEDYLQSKVDYTVATPAEDRKRVVFDIQPGPKFSDVEIVFDGAKGLPASKLRDVVEDQKLTTDVYVAPGRVTETLTRLYQEFGYLDAEVETPRYELNSQTATGKVVFPVAEGPLYRIGEVSFEGNSAIGDAQLAAAVPVPKGEPYRPVLRDNAIQRLRDVYWEHGYNDVQTEMALDRNSQSGTVDVSFKIEEGPQAVVSEIVVQGTTNTSENMVRTQLELEPGAVLDLKKLSASRRNLYNTGAYSLVEILREEINPAEGEQIRARQAGSGPQKLVRLRVRVREIQPFLLRYGGLFDTERGPGGIVDLSNRNSLGSARVLGFRGRYDSQLQEARIYFSQPLLRRFPVKTIASPFFRRERNPATTQSDPFNVDRIGFSIQQEARPWQHYLLNYGYRLERARTYDAGPNVLQELLIDPPLRIGSLTGTLMRETRDELLDATRGSFMSHAIQWAPPLLGSQQHFAKYFGQYFKYVPLEKEEIELFTNEILRPRLVYAGGVRLGLATGFGGETVPLSERFFAGGGTTIRGFEQNSLGPLGPARQQLGGQAMLVVNNELRFPLFWIFDGVGFSDIGNVWESASEFSFSDIRKTAGLGLRLRAPWFLLRLDYGVKLDRRPGEPRGRLFFSIGQAF